MEKLKTENILQHLPQKYYVVNVEKKEVVQTNDPDHQPGKCYSSLFDNAIPCGESNQECTCEQLMKKTETGDFVVEKGEKKDKRFYKASFKKLDDKLVVLNYMDVTEEYRVKKELKINTRRLQRAERLADFGYWEFNIDEKIVLSSKGARQIYGVSEEKISVEEIQKIPLPEYRQLLDNSLQNLIQNDEPYNVKFKIKRPSDGGIRIIHSIAEYRKDKRMVFGVINDITEKTESQNALEESLIDLKLAQKFAKVGNWKFNPVTQHLEWSDEIYKIFERELKSGPIRPEENDNYFSDDSFLTALKSAIVTGKAFQSQYKLTLPNGKEKWIEVICQPEKSSESAGHFLRGTIQDITYSKNAEEEINRTNNLLRTVIDLIPDSIYMKDSNYRKLVANKGDAEHCGVENINDILGKSDYDLYPQEIADIYTADDKKVIENGKQIINREELLPDGDRERWVLTSKIPLKNNEGEIIGLVGIGRDITEFKKQESQLRLFKQTIEQSPLSVIITNTDGDIEYVNEGFTETTGYPQSEVIGKNPRFLKSGKHANSFYEELWDTILSGKNWNGEFHNKKKDGRLYWERAVIAPVFDNHKEIKHFVSINEDISEKKRMIEELEIARDKAEESDQLKSLFLANMSHEIRTPLNGILGFSNVICSGEENNPETLQNYGTIIQNCGQRLMTVIDDIIDISMIQSNQLKIERKNFEINELLQEVFTLYKSQKADKLPKIEFKVGFCENPEHNKIYSDKNRVFQVLKNLLDNAFKFTETGFIEFGCSESSDDELILYVEDSGIGIEESKNKIIFESFRQAEEGNTRKYEGTGLGLAITSGIMERLGGKIWIQSEVGIGTAFYVALPRSEKTIVDSKDQKKLNNTKSLKKIILSIEDDAASVAYFRSVAQTMDSELINFEHAEQGIEYLKDNHVDLVLMDIELPETDGYEATRKIKAKYPDLPVIVQTAYAMKGDEQKAFDAGCDEYLSKPVGLNILKEKIIKHTTN